MNHRNDNDEANDKRKLKVSEALNTIINQQSDENESSTDGYES